jgi:hypothetical protein
MNPLLRRVESFLMLAFVLEVKEVSITGEQYIDVLTALFFGLVRTKSMLESVELSQVRTSSV